MKRSALFLTAAVTGLVCGSLFRWGTVSAGASSASPARRAVAFQPELGKNSPLSQEKPQAVHEWETRLAGYLNAPLTASVSGVAASPQAQAENVLKLLREPVSASTMKEAVTFLNANGYARYGDFMTAVFERWAREDPEAALAASLGLREPTAKAALVWKVFELSAKEPGMMAKAMKQPKGLIRSVALAALADSVPPGRESEALQAFVRDWQPGNWKEGGSFPQALFDKLHRGDPLRSVPPDPGAPLRLALETQDPAWRSFLLKAALTHENAEPLIKLEELARDPRNVEGLMEVIGNKVPLDLMEMKNVLAALPKDKRREVLVRQAGLALSGDQDEMIQDQPNTGGVKNFLHELEQSVGNDALRGILSESALRRGAQGLEDAAKWLSTRQDAAGLEDLTRRAALAEPFTTARWLAGMPQSAERDRAVAVFAETHAAVDPERAAVWAASISDPNKKAAAMEKVRKSSR